VAKELEGYAHFAAVDIEASQDLAKRYGVQGVPTIKMFAGAVSENPYTRKKERDSVSNYDGDRKSRALKRWVYNNLPSKVAAIEGADVKSFVEDTMKKAAETSTGSPSVVVVLFSSKDTVSPQMKALSLRFAESKSASVQLAQLTSESSKEAMSSFGIEKTPAMALFSSAHEDKLKPTLFEGASV
jgi:thioredoxin-like negative regulator of GroEL